MSKKSAIMWGMMIGSTVGGFVPSLWEAGMFSMSGVLLTAIGGVIGIWFGYKYG